MVTDGKLVMAQQIKGGIVLSMGPQGFWGSWENGHLFSGSWGALVIIYGELGSKLIILGI